jgi:hypothetical protein
VKINKKDFNEIADYNLNNIELYFVTCGPIAKEGVDKYVSVEMDSWKPTPYGTHFRGYGGSTRVPLDGIRYIIGA